MGISYLPLAHVYERVFDNAMLGLVSFSVCFACNSRFFFFFQGASMGVYSGDQLTLMDDVAILSPTIFPSVPRLFNRMTDKTFQKVQEKSFWKRLIFKRGLNSKLANLRKNGAVSSRFWDALPFKETKAKFGNQLRFFISGGAPLDALVQEQVKCLFCAPLLEGYGLTETFGPAFLSLPGDPISGHVGGVLPCNEFRLKSIPEMDYLVSDSPPRGELQMRGHSVSPGYFLDPVETKEAIDKDGWFSTGDVAALLPGSEKARQIETQTRLS